MTNGWHTVNLGKLLTRIKDAVLIEDFETYQRLTIHLANKGIDIRDEVAGHLIGTKKQFVVHKGQFLLSKIDAMNGAFGVVPENVSNGIITSNFWAYDVDEERLLPKYFNYLTHTPTFHQFCIRASSGTTHRKYLQENVFLGMEIPLPPLTEQRRIVTRIEALAARVTAAQSLRRDVRDECELLLRSMLFDTSHGEPKFTPMRELVILRTPDVTVVSTENYHFAGVYSFGRGVFRGINRSGNQFAYPKLTRLRTKDFTYPKLMAWEGAYGIVPPECDGLVVSTEFPVFELNQEKILPEILDVYFRNPAIWETLSGQSTGTNVRRRRLNPQTFLSYKFPLPPMKQQLLLREVYMKVTSLRAVQAESERELSALMPSILDKAFKGEL